MGRPRFAYLLIALMLLAQVLDACASALVSSSSLSADIDDEYLLTEPRQHSEQGAPRQKPKHVSLKLQTVDFFFIRRSGVSGPALAVPFVPSQLYVFMSLQC
jgi:hypothetical protein